MVCPAVIIFKVCVQEIWEEKNSQYHKHDKELYQYNYQERLTYTLITDTFTVKSKYFF